MQFCVHGHGRNADFGSDFIVTEVVLFLWRELLMGIATFQKRGGGGGGVSQEERCDFCEFYPNLFLTHDDC